MRKRIKADSVDELFEIVKAVQNGEEPEEYAKRKRAAERAAEEAAKRKRMEARAAEREAEEAARRERMEARAAERKARDAAKQERSAGESTVYEESAVEEDFEQLLEDDSEEEFAGLKSALQGLGGYLSATGSFLSEKSRTAKESLTGWKESASQKLSQVREANKRQKEERSAQKTEHAAEPEMSEETIAHEPKRSVTGETIAHEPKRSVTGETTAPEPKHPAVEETFEPGPEMSADGERIRELGRVHLMDIEKEPVGKTRRRYGAKTVSEESETIGKRILHSLHMDSPGTDQEEKVDSGKAAIGERAVTEASPAAEEKSIAGKIPAEEEKTAAGKIPVEEEKTAAGKIPAEEEKTAAGKIPAEEEKSTVGKTPAAEENRAAGTEAPSAPRRLGDFDESDEESIDLDTVQILDRLLDVPTTDSGEREERKETVSQTVVHEESALLRSWKKVLVDVGQKLSLSKKRAAVIGSAAAAVFLIIIVTACMLYRSSQIQEKRKYVTAEEGLTVTVENQPTEWCSSCELQMKISVKKGTISAVEIDGTAVEPDEKGYVTANAQSRPLEVVVTTEEGTLTASVEIPMLDTDAPVVTADIYGGQITLTAADTRSGAAGIYYAVVEDDDWLQLPQYQKYSEPIPYNEDCLYYFYAVDQAGNRSAPVVSNMVSAESIVLSETALTLYPEGTAYLEAGVTPSNALLTNLQYESSNTDVVIVNSSGLVTAVAEGSALIKVTADGVDMATCTVDVVTETVITVSAVGDCTLGTYKGSVTSTSFDTYYSMYGASWFFQNVKEILANDDVTFANLEGPLTDATTAADKTYAFKGDPSYTEILQDGSIEVVTLANNHSSDYGSEGLSDTKENLTAAGIAYCTGDTIAYQEISGVKVALIGIYELAAGLECETQVRETIAEAQTEGAQLIIVAFHWGTEKENYPDETQQSLAHTAIDCGADLVVGHHPHVLQGIEKYNGKYIVYSLGNFCFGGNSNPSDKDTMIFRQTFTISADGVSLDDDIEIIPCTLSSASGYNDYRPTPATGTAADEIMERINEYSAQFGDITYTASTGL